MHKRFVILVVSRISLVVSSLMLLPLAWAFYDNPGSLETQAFCKTIGLGIFVFGAIGIIFRFRKEDYNRVNAKDGLAIVGISWIFLSVLGALPLYWSHSVLSFTDAFFEIVSGFTTTGATIFTDVESLPRGILFWRSLTHWLGGMGIIVLYIALLPALGNNTFQLYKAEAPGLTVERVGPRIKETAKYLWGIYFLLTFLEAALLMFGGMSFFESLCHTFGTVATGGFSTRNASIGAFSPYIQWVVCIFMFLAGTNFILHYQALLGKPGMYLKNEEFRGYFILIIFLIVVFGLVLALNGTVEHAFRDATFQVLSILTTTGYVTSDFELWPFALQFILVMLMFIGGCGGSTGGGMKFIRFFLSIKTSIRAVEQSVFPNAVLPVKYNGKPLPEGLVVALMSYFVTFLHLFFAGTILLTITESCDLITAFTAAISSLSNIGPGLGRVGPMDNFAWVSVYGKWILSFLMLAGRLELYSILILLSPATWKK